MEVVNNQKVQAKSYIRNDLKSNVTNISHESNEIQNTLAMLNYSLDGSPMGAGSETATARKPLVICLRHCKK